LNRSDTTQPLCTLKVYSFEWLPNPYSGRTFNNNPLIYIVPWMVGASDKVVGAKEWITARWHYASLIQNDIFLRPKMQPICQSMLWRKKFSSCDIFWGHCPLVIAVIQLHMEMTNIYSSLKFLPISKLPNLCARYVLNFGQMILMSYQKENCTKNIAIWTFIFELVINLLLQSLRRIWRKKS